jgi:hypothetical protein
MFSRRGRYETVPTHVRPSRAGTVRLLETEEELQAAVERARAFERLSAGLEAIRALKYEHYLHEPGGGLAKVVPIDTQRPAASERSSGERP